MSRIGDTSSKNHDLTFIYIKFKINTIYPYTEGLLEEADGQRVNLFWNTIVDCP